uniref:40S ribosomal protein S7 n=1 Tax=Lactuca sativa TaxID=4236 RepID=A0A9R1X0S8_LACSA|nr:hypothetical protein LSAT_V11C700348930 [Lactuca sativa]
MFRMIGAVVACIRHLAPKRPPMSQALFDFENTHQELKSDLKDLYLNSANQIDVGNKKAVVIHVPYRLRKLIGYEPCTSIIVAPKEKVYVDDSMDDIGEILILLE